MFVPAGPYAPLPYAGLDATPWEQYIQARRESRANPRDRDLLAKKLRLLHQIAPLITVVSSDDDSSSTPTPTPALAAATPALAAAASSDPAPPTPPRREPAHVGKNTDTYLAQQVRQQAGLNSPTAAGPSRRRTIVRFAPYPHGSRDAARMEADGLITSTDGGWVLTTSPHARRAAVKSDITSSTILRTPRPSLLPPSPTVKLHDYKTGIPLRFLGATAAAAAAEQQRGLDTENEAKQQLPPRSILRPPTPTDSAMVRRATSTAHAASPAAAAAAAAAQQRALDAQNEAKQQLLDAGQHLLDQFECPSCGNMWDGLSQCDCYYDSPPSLSCSPDVPTAKDMVPTTDAPDPLTCRPRSPVSF